MSEAKMLPIKIDAAVMTECWTHVKLSVTQASPHGAAWLASHFEIYMDNEYKIYFGHINQPFRMIHFAEILSFKEIDILSIDPAHMADALIREINQNNYMLINLLFEGNIFHYYLFHGYDKKTRMLYFARLIDGAFRQVSMSFDDVNKYYTDFYNYRLRNPEMFHSIGSNSYCLTKISVRDDYTGENCFEDAFMRFDEEMRGSRYGISPYTDGAFGEEAYYYTGLACLKMMEVRVFEYLRDQEYIVVAGWYDNLLREMQLNFQKLSEHRYIILCSMEWMTAQFTKIDGTIYPVIEEYKACCRTVKQIANLATKFAMSKDWDILRRIQTLITGEYEKEKNILSRFTFKMQNMYFNK